MPPFPTWCLCRDKSRSGPTFGGQTFGGGLQIVTLEPPPPRLVKILITAVKAILYPLLTFGVDVILDTVTVVGEEDVALFLVLKKDSLNLANKMCLRGKGS